MTISKSQPLCRDLSTKKIGGDHPPKGLSHSEHSSCIGTLICPILTGQSFPSRQKLIRVVHVHEFETVSASKKLYRKTLQIFQFKKKSPTKNYDGYIFACYSFSLSLSFTSDLYLFSHPYLSYHPYLPSHLHLLSLSLSSQLSHVSLVSLSSLCSLMSLSSQLALCLLSSLISRLSLSLSLPLSISSHLSFLFFSCQLSLPLLNDNDHDHMFTRLFLSVVTALIYPVYQSAWALANSLTGGLLYFIFL